MNHNVGKVIKWFDDSFEEFLLIIFLILITAVTFIQVIVRKMPWIPSLTWAEEFARFVWIWSVFLSLPYTIRKCTMLRVTVLLDLLPQTARKTLDILVDRCTISCMGLFFYYSIPVVTERYISGETSPAMLWPMWTIYAFMVIGFGLGTLRGIEMLIRHISHFKEKQLSTLEQAQADAQAEIDMINGAENTGGDA